ncbi:MAG: DUF4129 domain-containing protein [Myxococcales bacterium]|nr:DUF4129 domain-containing protein [Myxococcales bacterium]
MSALDWLDRAFALMRLAGRPYALRAWLAGGPLALLSVFAFYLERVEGVRSARALLALALALAWWWRTHWLGSACGLALEQLEGAPQPAARDVPGVPQSRDSVRSLALSGVAGTVLACALVPAAAMARLGGLGLFVGFGLALPLGALAPSWVAQGAVAADGGRRAWVHAFRDGASLRGSALLLHAALFSGTLLLFVNVLAVVAMLLAALQGLVGMEVAALGAFMSFENDFALLATAAAALWLIEPLRGAVALIALLHARSQRDGADLRRMVQALESGARGLRTADKSSRAAGLVLVAMLLHGAPVRAQEPSEETPPASSLDPAEDKPPNDETAPSPLEPSTEFNSEDDVDSADYLEPAAYTLPPLDESDEATAGRVASILSGSEFREFEDARSDSQRADADLSWLERLLEAIARWLREHSENDTGDSASSSPMPVPPTWLFVTLALVLLLAVLAYLALTWRREQAPRHALDEALGLTHDPRERAPEEHLGEAARLASEGRHREAFRSLYLATLVALDRHREIDFDPARTNWHYLRQMGPGERAAAFRTFTQLFDAKWYGDEHTTREEYERGRALAVRLTTPPALPRAVSLEGREVAS